MLNALRTFDRNDSLKAALGCESALDMRTYEKGIKISDAEMKTLDMIGDLIHPEWNSPSDRISSKSEELIWRMS